MLSAFRIRFVLIVAAVFLPVLASYLNRIIDEDDVVDIDPSSEFGLDRFEKSEELAATISRRMAAKKKQKLNDADPT